MIRVYEVTKQDRVTNRIMNGIAGTVKKACSLIPYADHSKNGLNYDTLAAVIDFGISEGAFMPSYKLKDWLANVKYFFDNPSPRDVLMAIYNELQKYPQGSVKGHN